MKKEVGFKIFWRLRPWVLLALMPLPTVKERGRSRILDLDSNKSTSGPYLVKE